MRNLIILILLAVTFGVSAAPEYKLREALRSEELRQAYEYIASDFERMTMDETARQEILQVVWSHANRSTPVDNRAYLFALAIDLYNSLSPGKDPTGYEMGEFGGKGDWRRQLQDKISGDHLRRQILSRMNPKPEEPLTDEEYWQFAVRMYEGQPESIAAFIEREYIAHYLRENIALDDFYEPAALEPWDLQLSSPTHYAELTEYMGRMRAAMESGTPPWQTTTQPNKAAARKQPAAAAVTTARVGRVDYAAEQEPALPDAPQPNESDGVTVILWIVAVLLMLTIAVVLIRSGRRK